MSDAFIESLTDLDEYYPGSRQRRPEVTVPETHESDDPDWADPLYRREYPTQVNGDPQEFWTVGAVATALNRKAVTIRLWERKGWIPLPNFRTPAGGALAGKRLYTRAQIEGLRLIAEEEGLLYSQVSPTKTNFTARAIQLFRDLEATN